MLLYKMRNQLQGIKTVTVNHPPFHPGTELPIIRANYIFQGAGMGDFICYLPAMIYLAENCPWIYGRIFCPDFLVAFTQNIMDKYENWLVYPNEKLQNKLEPNSLFVCPGMNAKGQTQHQLANGTGGHLVDVGFLYFVNKFPVPQGWDLYPVVAFDPRLSKPPYGEFVVFTPGAVSENRMATGNHLNPIIQHVKKLGLNPVFLGKRHMSTNLHPKFAADIDYGAGVDLRDKTTMLEAAWIMKHAKLTVGLDNGLLHLAACTDAKILAVFNTVDPRERKPHRPAGRWESLTLTEQELVCIHCQSRMPQMFPHTFNRCLYSEPEKKNKCIDILFDNGGARWTNAIDKMLQLP